jgi:predicted aspartyl protease
MFQPPLAAGTVMGFFSRSFSVLLLLVLSFGAGWGMRGLTSGQEDMPVASSADKPPTQTRATSMAADHDRREDPAQLSSFLPPAVSPAPQQLHEEPDKDSRENLRNEFRALLQAHSFSAAMNLYSDIERRSSRDAAELKRLIMDFLATCLERGDGGTLTDLVDAYLSRYYGDIEVLVLLARYHLASGYSAEAARTFQLAFTYAFTPSEKQRVDLAFGDFVQETDERLVSQQKWRQLISFYETLELLDLTQPPYQLRQAELYMSHGEWDYGRDLLTRLSSVPSVAAKAASLLRDSRPDVRQDSAEVQRSHTADAIPLQVVGSHYYLPLGLNSAGDVHLIIDTGATTTTLSKPSFDAISSHAGFTELGPRMFNTAGGITKGTLYRVAEFRLGDRMLSDVDIAVLDFEMPPGVDGLLGMNVLRHFRFRVDQDEQRLYLRPRATP